MVSRLRLRTASSSPKIDVDVLAPVASGTLSVNVFTAPRRAMLAERPTPFVEAFALDSDIHLASFTAFVPST